MSPGTFGAVLTLTGLVAELIAVVGILVSVGIAERLASKIASAWRRAIQKTEKWFRRVWPWAHRKTTYEDSALGNLSSGGTAGGSLRLSTGMAPPKSFEEVGQRLEELRDRWNQHEREIERQNEALRKEIEVVDSRSANRVSKIDAMIREEARRTLAERTREGALLALGIVFQVCGAAALLLNWSPL